MRSLLLEIRDRGTFIPVLAQKFSTGTDQERWLLERAGYGRETDDQSRYVLLTKLVPVETQYDPYSWATRARTMPTAHQWIIERWDDLSDGDVVDVEFILGERKEPKVSEYQPETV